VGYVFTGSDLGGNDAADSDVNPATGRTPVTTLVSGENDPTWDAGIFTSNAPAGTASLGNRVWNDIDNDGIQDAGEAGVGGVTVTLYAGDGTTVIGTTVTDALGNYIFTGLPAGAYVVGFSNFPAGFTLSASGAGSDRSTDSDANTGTGKTGVINLSVGEDNMTIDAGLHQDPTKASLGNFVWLDADADGVQDAGEQGVGGVRVDLLNASGAVLATTWTDNSGYYSFSGLNPGDYMVQFSGLPNGMTLTTANAGGNDSLDSDADAGTGRTAITTLTAGENDPTWDAGLINNKASLGDRVWFDDDRDGIQDAGERGVSGVTVILYDAAGNPVASTITDANGNYLFANLNPGTYSVGFSTLPSGTVFSPQGTGTPDNDSNVNPSTGRTAPVTLVAGSNNMTVDAGIMSPPRAGLGNFVWSDIDGDGVQDAGEPGLAGVTVQLWNADRTAVLATTVTDGNGYYTFSNLEPGTYNVKFIAPTGSTITGQNQGGNTATDSDADPNTGFTGPYILAAGDYNATVDAGIKPPLTLPVDYLSIKVYAKNEMVVLDWSTVNELNNEKFDVERVRNTNEVPEYVGFVTGRGTTNAVQKYSFTDVQPMVGKSYYRLIQVDFDGRRTPSKWYSVMNEKGKVQFELLAYPNPATNRVSVELSGSAGSEIGVSILDMSGRVVQSQMHTLTNDGTSVYEMNTEKLAQGVYMLRATNQDDTKVLKLVIEK
jgi:protocatechuate 3,4-dioxygenase beta subunit